MSVQPEFCGTHAKRRVYREYQWHCAECDAEKLMYDKVNGIFKMPEDVVARPEHYRQGTIETIDAIESLVSGKGPFEGYLIGNVIKYLSRYNKKGGAESVKKAAWYLSKLLKVVELAEGKK